MGADLVSGVSLRIGGGTKVPPLLSEDNCPPTRIGWVRLDQKGENIFMASIDTDPNTRHIGLVELSKRFRIPPVAVANADRMHITFLPGSFHYTKPEIDLLQRFIKRANGPGQLYVIGYGGAMEGELDEDEISFILTNRVKKAISLVRDSLPSILVKHAFSHEWKGEPSKARRVDVYWVKEQSKKAPPARQ